MEKYQQAFANTRTAFKGFNRFMLLLWRLGLGRDVNSLPGVMGRIMVIVHKGRKSGLRRFNPVNYAIVEGDVYCMAGFGSVSDWYRNILADSQVEVWLPDGWWEGRAEEMTNTENRLDLVRQLMVASGLVARLIGVDPGVISDAELAAATVDYRLVRIRRGGPRTGAGGPGDLAWVWPYTVFGLLLALLLRRRK
jgi:deazaflavin-dependent oxidoreductase (nitroreductase family)